MGRILYNVFLGIYILISLPSILSKGKFKDRYSERWGCIPENIRHRIQSKKIIWIHAVSVGEVRLACNMIEGLRAELPEHVCLMTLNTRSSREIAEKLLPSDRCNVMYFPLDFSWIMRRFIRRLNPQACVIVETEIWPNMIDILSLIGCPIVLVNGRISDKAFRSYRRIAPFMRPYVRRINHILVQNETFKKRFLNLGASVDSVKITGNMKYDLKPSEEDGELKRVRASFDSNLVHVLLASTHHPEEEVIIGALKDLIVKRNIMVWLAPRHLDRLDSIRAHIRGLGYRVGDLSGIRGSDNSKGLDILLIDEWGILNKCYPFVDCVVMGGSFTDIGGHNIGEPAVCGKMIFHGPHMSNFEDMRQLFLKQNASIEVSDAQQLKKQLENFIQNREPYQLIANRARVVMRSSMGATKRNVEVVQNVITKN